MASKIEWLQTQYGIPGETWNPITGCTKISEGCKNCYAERMSKRLAGRFGYPKDEPFRVTLHPDRLEQPTRWRRHRRVFVCSMSDLFHKDVPDNFIDQVFSVMTSTFSDACQHTYLILTKRPERILQGKLDNFKGWPHIWLGVTAENQQRADERIPILLQIPAAVRFVSIEPMLGPVDLTQHYYTPDRSTNLLTGIPHDWDYDQAMTDERTDHLDWVICGGESGPGARPMHPDWVRSVRDQCQDAGVPFFFKQWGEWCYPAQMPDDTFRDADAYHGQTLDYGSPYKVGKKAACRLLDGREWNEYPVTQGDPS